MPSDSGGGAASPDVLPFTGGTVLGFIALAVTLLGLGGVVSLAVHRREQQLFRD